MQLPKAWALNGKVEQGLGDTVTNSSRLDLQTKKVNQIAQAIWFRKSERDRATRKEDEHKNLMSRKRKKKIVNQKKTNRANERFPN